MIDISVVVAILAIHWLADFVAQSSWMAINKSKKMTALLAHTFCYSTFWVIPACIVGILTHHDFLFLSFTFITLVTHTIIDYFTSRLNSKLWEEKKVHEFFVSIGFDQLLHYIQLILTYCLLTK